MKLTAILSFIWVLCIGILPACSPDETPVSPVEKPENPEKPDLPPNPEPDPTPTPDPYLVSVFDSTWLDRGSLVGILGANPGDPFVSLLPQGEMRVDVLLYNTIDPEGNRVVASGTIAYPAKGSFRGVVMGEHFTVATNEEVPSNCKVIFETALALFGYVVVSPDYLGFGATANLPHPYLDVKSAGQTSVDLLLAAREYMAALARPIEKPVFVVGYSQGAFTALAFQKLVEEKYAEEIPIRKVFAGGGPYDPEAMFDLFVSEDYTAYPCAVPLTVIGMDYGSCLGLDYSKVFKEPLLSHYAEWYLSKKYTLGQLNRELGSNQLSAFMHPDMFRTGMNSELDKLYEALRANGLTDWTPKAPILLVHGKKDENVPFINSQHAYDSFTSRGCNVELITLPGNHKETAIPFYLSVLGKLL